MIKDNKGFTLIELLVVVAIIGILSAIALPMFNRYKERAYNTQVQSLISNMMKAQEAYYVDNETYLSCTVNNGVSTCGALPGMGDISLQGFSMIAFPGTDGVLLAGCHVKAPKGAIWITDPALPHYEESNGKLIDINVGVGQCSLSIFTDALS